MSDATVHFAHEIARLQGQLAAETAARAGLESRLEKVELAVANMGSFHATTTSRIGIALLDDLRVEALRLAVKSVNSDIYQPPKEIVATAAAFHAFLLGDKKGSVPVDGSIPDPSPSRL